MGGTFIGNAYPGNQWPAAPSGIVGEAFKLTSRVLHYLHLTTSTVRR